MEKANPKTGRYFEKTKKRKIEADLNDWLIIALESKFVDKLGLIVGEIQRLKHKKSPVFTNTEKIGDVELIRISAPKHCVNLIVENMQSYNDTVPEEKQIKCVMIDSRGFI